MQRSSSGLAMDELWSISGRLPLLTGFSSVAGETLLDTWVHSIAELE